MNERTNHGSREEVQVHTAWRCKLGLSNIRVDIGHLRMSVNATHPSNIHECKDRSAPAPAINPARNTPWCISEAAHTIAGGDSRRSERWWICHWRFCRTRTPPEHPAIPHAHTHKPPVPTTTRKHTITACVHGAYMLLHHRGERRVPLGRSTERLMLRERFRDLAMDDRQPPPSIQSLHRRLT